MQTQPQDWSEPQLTVNGTKVLEKRYLKRTEEEVLETPGGRFYNVAKAIAEAYPEDERENYTRLFYDMMASCEFMPNSPTLMNAGKGNGLQLSACYVLPVEDNMEGIFETVKRTALVHKSGGGTGFSFSRLRPSGDFVGGTGGVASGPVSFMTVINETTEEVKQGGTRRGANMGILRIDHPDVLSFINCKRNLSSRSQRVFDSMSSVLGEEEQKTLKKSLLEGQISNFNISVAVTEEFMQALREERMYELRHPSSGNVVALKDAREVWETLIECAWSTGDPGLIFLDRINNGPGNPVPSIGPVESTNPCGEQPLYPNEACNLGSINLSKFTDGINIDWTRLGQAGYNAVFFLDGVITVNPYPDRLIDECVKANRRVGLGVMGWADLLIKLGIPYASQEAVELGEKVMECVNENAKRASRDLASKYGAFPNFEQSIYSKETPRRNSTVTTIAPTGTISIISGCSSGVEPLFALCFDRSGSLDGTLDVEVYDELEVIARREGFWSPELGREILRAGTLAHVESVPKHWRNVFATAHDVSLEYHVSMQAAFQKNTENAVSKTINLTHDADISDVAHAYQLAYNKGCMGITVYRDGCKEGVLHIGTSLPVIAGGSEPQEGYCDCGTKLAYEENCMKCYNCGWSACSIG